MISLLENQLRMQVRRSPTFRYYLKKAQQKFLGQERPEFYKNRVFQIFENIDLDRIPKKLDEPEGTLIEITNACNLDCMMCQTHLSARETGLMEPELFERIVLESKAMGLPGAGLHTVGETFVYKDLGVLIEIAERHNFPVWISTNAQFPERLKELYSQFPNMITNLRLSIDGATRETFESIRRGASFDKLIETCEVIYEINRKKKNYRIFTTIGALLNSETVLEIPIYFQQFDKYVEPRDISFGLITGLALDDSYFKETFPFENLIRHEAPCDYPFSNLHYTYDGKATVCCLDFNAELVI